MKKSLILKIVYVNILASLATLLIDAILPSSPLPELIYSKKAYACGIVIIILLVIFGTLILERLKGDRKEES